MAIPAENNEPPNGDQHRNRRRGKKSIVWDHFTIEQINAECTRAFCNQCKKSFAYITGSKLAGTSHLKRHIDLGICPVSRLNQEKNRPTPCTAFSTEGTTRTYLPRKRLRGSPGSAYPIFDQDHCSLEIAKMIMLHEYPISIVEHPGFVNFLRTIHPHFHEVNISTIEGECIGIYLREKQSILNLLGGVVGRVNLALDFWTSDQGLGYLLLSGYFVDSDWKLQRRILSVVMLPFPDSEIAFNNAVVACLTDWGLENKLFTLTLDKSFACEAVRRNLRSLLSIKNPIVLNGQLLLGDCYARVLSCLAKDALDSTSKIVKKVRDSVKYVKTLEGNEEKFIKLKEQLQNPSTMNLVIDDQRKWNTTYHMLVAANELKEVFSCLDTSDPNYIEMPSIEEWRQVEILCTYLKLLYDAANILLAPKYPTTDVFFHEVWKIQLELTEAAMSQDTFVSNLTKPLKGRFNEYWNNCSLVFAIAVIMDPRYKMKLVEFSFSKIYGKDTVTWIKVVDEGVHELFLEYIVLSLPPPTFLVEDCEIVKIEMTQEDGHLSAGDCLSDFDVYISEIMSSQQMKSELDQYLEESLVPRVHQEFDVLAWWKLNMQNYPTLSKMASDILSIPVSTVSSEFVFDTSIKKMDGHQSSLRPLTIEALICAKDWLRYGSSEFQIQPLKMEFSSQYNT